MPNQPAILNTPRFVRYTAGIWHEYPRVGPTIAALVGTVLGIFLVFSTEPNLPLALGVVARVFLLIIALRYMPTIGVFALLAAVLLLEQFQIFGLDDIVTMKVPIYLNLNSLTGIGPLVMNQIEVLFAVVVMSWCVRAAVSRRTSIRPIPHFWVAMAFLGVLVFYTMYGLARNGDLKAALWEIRALYYLCISYFLATQLVLSRRQIRLCVWIIIVMVTVKGVQGCWRFFVTLGGNLTVAAITGHEDALFITTAFILCAAFMLHGYFKREFWVLMIGMPPMLITFFLTQRRITYGTLAMSCGIVFLLLPWDRKKVAIKLSLPFIPILMLYSAAFWNSQSTLGVPVQQVKSIFETGKGEDSSNTYRRIENFNLQETIRQYPQGTGFGKKYLVLISLPFVDFPLWDYIPHNCIYWVWVKTGFPGFVVFWLFFGVMIAQTTLDYRLLKDPFFKSVTLMVLTFTASQIAVAYYDLQITFYRNMIYLGTAMAIPAAARRIEAREQELVTEEG